MTANPDRRIVATHLLDTLDAVTAELSHWLATGDRVVCPRCAQLVPATADQTPVRHQSAPAVLVDRQTVVQVGDWCEAGARP